MFGSVTPHDPPLSQVPFKINLFVSGTKNNMYNILTEYYSNIIQDNILLFKLSRS